MTADMSASCRGWESGYTRLDSQKRSYSASDLVLGALSHIAAKLDSAFREKSDRLLRETGNVAVALVGSLSTESLWEGSDIDILVVKERYRERTPAFDCELIQGVIVHSTILTRQDLLKARPLAISWIQGCKTCWDKEKIIEKALTKSRAETAQKKEADKAKEAPTLQDIYRKEFLKPHRSLRQGDLASCLIHTRRAAINVSASWLGSNGIQVRRGGRRSFDQILSNMKNLGQDKAVKCLVHLFQAQARQEEVDELLGEMIGLSQATYNFLKNTCLYRRLSPSELGLMHHASGPEELGSFLEALYKPLAVHYPRSMIACCGFVGTSLAERVVRARKRSLRQEYRDTVLVRSLAAMTDLPAGFVDDFLRLQRLHSTQPRQLEAVKATEGTLSRLINRSRRAERRE